ncbi:hypothetical protein V1477_016227 [Vespula maculifrons]|uniref:Uncharacterized protein n=1 Tax=Vespula maculifrons TaxID=7453 RepID=A0ABD2BCG1_VESMC
MCRRGPHILWLKRATIDYKSFFKGDRYVEPFVNGLWSYQNPFTLYHVDTYARSSLFLDGDDGPFHLLATSQAFAVIN